MRPLVLFVICLFAATAALAAPSGGQATVGDSERGPGTATTSITTEGGNITETNVTGNPITTRWGAFWGEVSGGIFLGDSSNNIFFEWAVNDPTGSTVYATNETVSDWGPANIVAATADVMPSYLQEDAADNFTNTFNETGDFNSSSLDIANVPYIYLWQNGSQYQNYSTFALKTSDDAALIWAGNVASNLVSFREANTTDYQILVPTDDVGLTYNFYLEFR